MSTSATEVVAAAVAAGAAAVTPAMATSSVSVPVADAASSTSPAPAPAAAGAAAASVHFSNSSPSLVSAVDGAGDAASSSSSSKKPAMARSRSANALAAEAAAAALAAAAASVSEKERKAAALLSKEKKDKQHKKDRLIKGTVVLKVGSSSLSTADGKHLSLTTISHIVETIVDLHRQGYNVVLVTSGAVSVGCARMRLAERPKNLITKQALAAIGQSRLMRVYDDCFSHLDQPIAQVLLSRENLSQDHHYRNASNTFQELFRLGVVPIVNENDTVAVEELRFGDNDTLSALVGSLVEADWLFLLTDVDALYTADPGKNPGAEPIHLVNSIDELKVTIGAVGDWGTGGMATKIQAAKIATAAGVRTVITRSTSPGNIIKIIKGGANVGIGTQFVPQARPLLGKKRWIAHGYVPSGKIFLDEGAARAIREKASLFARGITRVEGDFFPAYNVSLIDHEGKEFARGLVNHSAEQINKVKGLKSSELEAALGGPCQVEIISRHNLALLAPGVPSRSPTSVVATVSSSSSPSTSSSLSSSPAAESASPALAPLVAASASS